LIIKLGPDVAVSEFQNKLHTFTTWFIDLT
jgi:hypothetical protein